MRNKLLIGAALAVVLAVPAMADDSLIVQQGLNQTATVDQTGSLDAQSDIDQSVEGNVADVTQTDTATAATVSNVNESTIIQQGIGNTATVTQHNNGGQAASANTSGIVQTNNNAVAEAEQLGIANTSGINQSGGGITDALVTQSGEANESVVFQTGAGGIACSNSDGGRKHIEC